MKSRCASSLAANKRGIQCLAVSDLEAWHPNEVMPLSLHRSPARCSLSLSLSPFLALTLTLARSSGTQPPYGLFVGFRVFGACGHTQVGSPPPPPPPPPPPSALPATGRTRLYKAALLSHAWLRPPPDLPQFTAPPLFASLTGVASRQQILLRRSLSQLASLKCRLSFKPSYAKPRTAHVTRIPPDLHCA